MICLTIHGTAQPNNHTIAIKRNILIPIIIIPAPANTSAPKGEIAPTAIAESIHANTTTINEINIDIMKKLIHIHHHLR